MALGETTRVMGILNITPDSFFDGGKYLNAEEAVSRALQMESEGADIIDIGGESSRPGAQEMGAEEESARILPVIKALASRLNIPISIDSRNSGVAQQALEAGASMINDIGGLRSPGMIKAAADSGVPVVLMHMQNDPLTMQSNPAYESVVSDLLAFFRERVEAVNRAGISNDRIVIDPGIGFGKNIDHNLEILKNLSRFHELGFPLLIGTSNKSFIGKILDLRVDQRSEGSLATVSLAAWMGIQIVRVHDVRGTVRAVRVIDAIRNA
ncbi:MAG TPA: dihydropteroate synthase [Nitrospiria bacterium]|nr:dihydropteroate synthase [Nitrospiria bacterium]